MLRIAVSFVFAVACAFAADVDAPLIVRAFGVAESNGQVWRVNVTVGNASQAPLRDIMVSVVPGGSAEWRVGDLGPGEWANQTIALRTAEYRSLVARADFTLNGRRGAVAGSISASDPNKPWWTAMAAAAIPVCVGALIGLCGGLLGAWSTSKSNLGKERLTARLQWQRFLVEHYDAAYRAFLTSSSGILQPAALRQQLQALDETALVPEAIRAMIASGIDAIEKAADADRKREARDALLRQLRAELLEPFRDEK